MSETDKRGFMIALKQGKENLHSVLLMAGAAVLWSLGGIFIKSIDANPMAIAGVRSGIAALLILAFLRKPKFTFSFPQVAAALAYSATVFLYVGANKTTTAANAILLQFTSPVYVALLGAWILKEKAKAFDWIIIAMVFAGMTLFFLDKLSPEGMLGNILAILSGVSFALFTIFMRKQKNGSSIESVLMGNILTAVIGIPFLLKSSPGGSGFMFLVLAGVVQLGIPYILFSIAIKHITALEAILTSTIEPILNPVWVLLFLGETPGPWALAGGAIVLSSIILRYFVARVQAKKVRESG